MTREVHRYTFDDTVPAEELEQTLLLSILAVESLHGESRVRLDGRYCLNARARECTIDASTVVGRDLNRIFVGFLCREFGPTSFRVRRVNEFTLKRQEQTT